LTSIQRKDAKSASLHSQGSERITGSSWTRTCRISDARIFAAGDAVRFPGPNGLVRQEDWCHAQDAIAGRNGAGANDEYRGADAGPHPDRRRSWGRERPAVWARATRRFTSPFGEDGDRLTEVDQVGRRLLELVNLRIIRRIVSATSAESSFRQSKLPFALERANTGPFVGMDVETATGAAAFQADDEGFDCLHPLYR
jgi:hypothetical protein